MKKPVPDKAEVAIDFPEKFYIGAFERGAQFDAHAEPEAVFLQLVRHSNGQRRTVTMHLHYRLFADILSDLAETLDALPRDDVAHREALAEACAKLAKASKT